MNMPVVFVSDFGPFPALENDDYTASLEKLGPTLPKPKAIVIMSGHAEAHNEVSATSSERPGITHDYSGFPPEFYRLDYPCAGDPILAGKIVEILNTNGFFAKLDPRRALDHGAWVPLSRMYPKADIPTVQISVLSGQSNKNFEIGRSLFSLRGEGVLLVASGALSHNLRLAFAHEKNDAPDEWVLKFDAWLKDKLVHGKVDEILNYKSLAPFAELAAPSPEHFDPLFFFLGAAAKDSLSFFHESIRFGNGLMKIIISGV